MRGELGRGGRKERRREGERSEGGEGGLEWNEEWKRMRGWEYWGRVGSEKEWRGGEGNRRRDRPGLSPLSPPRSSFYGSVAEPPSSGSSVYESAAEPISEPEQDQGASDEGKSAADDCTEKVGGVLC